MEEEVPIVIVLSSLVRTLPALSSSSSRLSAELAAEKFLNFNPSIVLNPDFKMESFSENELHKMFSL